MVPIDQLRDEVVYSGVLDCLRGRLVRDENTNTAESAFIDVPATNNSLVLGRHTLRDYHALGPKSDRVDSVEQVAKMFDSLAPNRLGVILLCGGIGTRSHGQIHPMLRVDVPTLPRPISLLRLRMRQLVSSPLADAQLFVMGSLYNEQALLSEIESLKSTCAAKFFCGGMVPRLIPSQKTDEIFLNFKDTTGRPIYNPGGHFDALRWIVASGLLEVALSCDVLMTASYSNIGKIFTEDSLKIASRLLSEYQTNSECIMLAEVVARPQSKRTGSMLVHGNSGRVHLVKYAYGRGEPVMPEGESLLMSTHTLYFHIQGLLEKICSAGSVTSAMNDETSFRTHLRAKLSGAKVTSQLANQFDRAFPVMPFLTMKQYEGNDSLQAERDLDQVSLLPDCRMIAIQVPPSRSISLKVSADLEDPMKRALLSESEY